MAIIKQPKFRSRTALFLTGSELRNSRSEFLLSLRCSRWPTNRSRVVRDGPTSDANIMAHATTERCSGHQSTSGTGGGAGSEGLLIKPTVSLLAAPSIGGKSPCFGGHQSNSHFRYWLRQVATSDANPCLRSLSPPMVSFPLDRRTHVRRSGVAHLGVEEVEQLEVG